MISIKMDTTELDAVTKEFAKSCNVTNKQLDAIVYRNLVQREQTGQNWRGNNQTCLWARSRRELRFWRPQAGWWQGPQGKVNTLLVEICGPENLRQGPQDPCWEIAVEGGQEGRHDYGRPQEDVQV